MVQLLPRDLQQSEAFVAPRDFIAATSTDFLSRGFVLGDTEPRYRVRADGRVEVGPGGTTVPDAGFERLAANVLGLLAADSWRIPTDGELQFGTDVVLSRGAADRLDLAAGDTLSVRTAIQLRQATANYSLEWADPAAARTITIPDPGAAANLMLDQGAYTVVGVHTHSGRIDMSAAPIRWTSGVAVTAAQYEITRDADATNQLHLNIPTGATFEFSVNDVAELLLSATNLTPGANDGNVLGSATVSWADLFLATGAVINWANGEVTITETDADTLTIAGVATRLDLAAGILEMNNAVEWDTGVAIVAGEYSVGRDGDATNQLHFNIPTGATFEFSVNDVAELLLSATNLTPGANDGNVLGSATVSWADLFLATGAVINWANGEVTITETDADTLTIAGVATRLDLAAGILEMNNAVEWDTGVAIVAGEYSVGRDGDATNQLHFNIPTGATFEFSVNDVAELLLSATALTPGANDGNILGSATVSWADLFLADGAIVNFNNGNLTMTHSAGIMTATGNWTFSGAGPFAIGGVTAANVGLYVRNTLPASGVASPERGVLLAPSISPTAGQNAYLFHAEGTIVEAASGVHAILTTVRLDPGTVTVGVATVTDTAIIYISAAMTATVTGTNYAVWVDAGPVRFDAARLDINLVNYSWPSAQGTAGQQLQTDGADPGVLSWAAAGSLREHKNILREANPQDALDQLLGVRAYHFHYKEGFGTRDYQTEYVGIMADEAPWAMHYGGAIVNPVNTLGYMVLGFQAVDRQLTSLEGYVKRLERALINAGIALPMGET